MRAGPVSMRCTRLIASLVALCAAAAQAQSPSAVASFADGPPNGAYAFASWTPKTMPELMKGERGVDPVNVVGHLFLPPGEGKVPAVVLVHGSGGIYRAMLDYWPKQLNAAGYAVFSLDLFGPRGATGVELDNSKVPFAADVADTYSALRGRGAQRDERRDQAGAAHRDGTGAHRAPPRGR